MSMDETYPTLRFARNARLFAREEAFSISRPSAYDKSSVGVFRLSSSSVTRSGVAVSVSDMPVFSTIDVKAALDMREAGEPRCVGGIKFYSTRSISLRFPAGSSV